MKSRALVSWFVAITLATSCLLLGMAAPARSQSANPPGLDHLACYTIKDSEQPVRYVADLENQFGLAPGCLIALPARLFCAETTKRITSTPVPPGGGPSGTPAGDFLCYLIRCPNSPSVPDFRVEDQFGRRPIELDNERLLCAPANKLICGDGNLDPGEACDPTSTTNTCPDGTPCPNTCQCGPQPSSCTTSGQSCTDAAGNAGSCVCDPATNGACTCVVPPPVACPCNASCPMADGTVGQCSPVAGATFCQCGPPQCPCGQTCTNAAGQTGQCRPDNDTAGLCQCVVPPPKPTPPQCPCDTSCTMDNGNVGLCQHIPGTNSCRCAPVPPPPQCPCFSDCVTSNNQSGRCLPTSAGGICSCVPKPPQPTPPVCPCSAQCATSNGQHGRCRQLPSLPPGTCACLPD